MLRVFAVATNMVKKKEGITEEELDERRKELQAHGGYVKADRAHFKSLTKGHKMMIYDQKQKKVVEGSFVKLQDENTVIVKTKKGIIEYLQ